MVPKKPQESQGRRGHGRGKVRVAFTATKMHGSSASGDYHANAKTENVKREFLFCF